MKDIKLMLCLAGSDSSRMRQSADERIIRVLPTEYYSERRAKFQPFSRRRPRQPRHGAIPGTNRHGQ